MCRFRLLLLVALSAGAFAYNQPVDSAGPVTVRLQPPAVGAYGAGGYADLSRPGVPFVVPVSLQNAADQPVSGTLRLAVADQWKIEAPVSVPFGLAPHGRFRHDFTVSFGAGTYTALYPIHAWAEFEYGGEKLTAHPVLIVQTRIPDLPRPRLPVEWKP